MKTKTVKKLVRSKARRLSRTEDRYPYQSEITYQGMGLDGVFDLTAKFYKGKRLGSGYAFQSGERDISYGFATETQRDGFEECVKALKKAKIEKRK